MDVCKMRSSSFRMNLSSPRREDNAVPFRRLQLIV